MFNSIQNVFSPNNPENLENNSWFETSSNSLCLPEDKIRDYILGIYEMVQQCLCNKWESTTFAQLHLLNSLVIIYSWHLLSDSFFEIVGLVLTWRLKYEKNCCISRKCHKIGTRIRNRLDLSVGKPILQHWET